MKFLCTILVMLLAPHAYAASVKLQTAGWCSPAVADIEGNVTIECHGVDPRALRHLNDLLDQKNLKLKEKLREAEEWAKKYRELEQRLAAESKDSELASQAQALMRTGQLEEAGAILDRLIEAGELEVDRIASYQYSRAQVYMLQFRPLQALPHYAKAYQYRPENPEYVNAYALALHKQNQYLKAEPVYSEALKAYRKLAESNPAAYLPYVATTLNNLGALFRDTQRLDQAQAAYQEALGIRRKLAESNPAAYLPDVALILNNLAVLFYQTQRLDKAEAAYQEALGIRRKLAESDPAAYLPDIVTEFTDYSRMN